MKINNDVGGETTGGFPWPPASGCAGDLEAHPIRQKRALCVTLTHYARHVSATPSHWIPLRGYLKTNECQSYYSRLQCFALVREFCNRVFLPCAQQEILSRSNTVTLHGLSTQNETKFEFVFAARAWHSK
jgi:hypothetical protein